MGDASTDPCLPLPRGSLEERQIRHRKVDQTLDDCLQSFFRRQSTLRELTAAPVESRESEGARTVYGRYHRLRRQGCWVRAADLHQDGGARQPRDDGAHPGDAAAPGADQGAHGFSAEMKRDPAWAWANAAISASLGLPRLPDCEEYAMVISPSAGIWQGGADQGDSRGFLACLGSMCGTGQPLPVLVQTGACSVVAVARAVGGGADNTVICGGGSVEEVRAGLCRLTVPSLRVLSAGGTAQKVARGSADVPLRLAAVAAVASAAA